MLGAVSQEAMHVRSLYISRNSEVGLELLASNDAYLGKFIHSSMYFHHNRYIERKEVRVRITIVVMVN